MWQQFDTNGHDASLSQYAVKAQVSFRGEEHNPDPEPKPDVQKVWCRRHLQRHLAVFSAGHSADKHLALYPHLPTNTTVKSLVSDAETQFVQKPKLWHLHW